MVSDQAVDRGAGDRDQTRRGRLGGVVDLAGWVADREHDRVDAAAGERSGLLVRRQLRSEREVGHGPPIRRHHRLGGGALARARVADVDPFAPEIGNGGDAGILTGDHGERLGVERQHGAQVTIGARAGERAVALVRMELPIALDDGHVELTGAQGLDVGDRAFGALHRAGHAVLAAALVDHPTDRAAGGIVDAGHPGGADVDRVGGLLRLRRAVRSGRRASRYRLRRR